MYPEGGAQDAVEEAEGGDYLSDHLDMVGGGKPWMVGGQRILVKSRFTPVTKCCFVVMNAIVDRGKPWDGDGVN